MAEEEPLLTVDDAREIIEDLQRIVAPTGIQESYQLTAGGIDHWVYARRQDRSNPVILFVHGGPASPLSPTWWQFQRPIEEYFTVVTYDQRAAGRTLRSVDPDSIADTLPISRYVDDAIELAEQIRDRYGVSKVILIGHSWGTVIGMHAALARPDLFHAYVGIGQVINARANETAELRLRPRPGQGAQSHRGARAARVDRAVPG